MENTKDLAMKDDVLRELVSNNEFDGEIYSSDDDGESHHRGQQPLDTDEACDDIDEMMIREEVHSATDLFKDLTEPVSSDDEEFTLAEKDFIFNKKCLVAENTKNLAMRDDVLRELVSNNAFDGEIYSSDDEFYLPFDTDEACDDINQMMIKEEVRSAKQLFKELTEPGSSDDEAFTIDENDFLHNNKGLVRKNKEFTLDDDGNFYEESDDIDPQEIVLKPNVKLSEALRYFESALDHSSKMRNALLIFKHTLQKKKTELQDMINALDDRYDGDDSSSESDEVVSWGFPGYLRLKEGVVVSSRLGLFKSQFSRPYFKDKQNFYCPPNQDSVDWDGRSAVSVTSLKPSKYWGSQSIEHLENAIRKCLIEEFKSKADFKALFRWREYSAFVKKHSLEEILKAKPPDYKLDWLKVAKLFPPEEERSDSECAKLWDLYLSPKLNKEWNEEEDDQILELVKKYEEHNWEDVAKELGTSKSGFQVFSYYQASLRKMLHLGEKWTHEEDEFIRNVVAGCTYGDFINWKKVMYYCEKKTYVQIYNRWTNNLVCLKKGRFSEREDRALITALAHGMGYKDTARALGGQRSSQQIRDRTMSIVKFGRDNALNVGDWSLEEDSKLLALVKQHGMQWPTVASAMGIRDRTQCRHRYQRIQKRLLKDPQMDLKLMLRRMRKGYKQTLRMKKRNLLKIMRKGLTQKRKKTFLHEVTSIMGESSEIQTQCYSIPSKTKAIVKYLAERGSGFWLPFDHCKASTTEIKGVIDYCTILDAKLDFDLYDESLKVDEHFKPAREFVSIFNKRDINPASSDEPSTSTTSDLNNVLLIPPNANTCHGFLQSLAFCANNDKIRHKWDINTNENDEVQSAKQLFQKRLYQMFLWPAILSGQEKADQVKSLGIQPLLPEKNTNSKVPIKSSVQKTP